jgi:hypothetical protein
LQLESESKSNWIDVNQQSTDEEERKKEKRNEFETGTGIIEIDFSLK